MMEIRYCKYCMQMTNHKNIKNSLMNCWYCLKCDDSNQSKVDGKRNGLIWQTYLPRERSELKEEFRRKLNRRIKKEHLSEAVFWERVKEAKQ